MRPISFCNGGIKMDNHRTSPLLVCGSLFVFQIRGRINPPLLHLGQVCFSFFFFVKKPGTKENQQFEPEHWLKFFSAHCALKADNRFCTHYFDL